MQYEAMLFGIRGIAQSIKTAEISLQLKPVDTAPGKVDNDLRVLVGQMDSWTARIRLWQREIRSRANMNDMIRQPQGPRGPASYSQRQSHQSHADNLRKLHEETLAASAALAALVAALGRGLGPEAKSLEAISSALESMMQAHTKKLDVQDFQVKKTGESIIAQIRQVDPLGSSGLDMSSPVDMFTLLLGVFVLVRLVQKRLTGK